MNDENVPNLRLPRRYEALERRATDEGIDLTRIVVKIEDAASRIEDLLRSVRDGGLGRFEIFLGNAGSGKTTFLYTLGQFFGNIDIQPINRVESLSAIIPHINSKRILGKNQLFFIADHDNPIFSREGLTLFFDELRRFFRTEEGRIVLVWPATDVAFAQQAASIAWEVGRESIVQLSKGIYKFAGLPKTAFYDVANSTSVSLNKGLTLESFGLTKDNTETLVRDSETIGEFYLRLEEKSKEINNYYRDILKDKEIPSIWILVAGDKNKDLNLTSASLTVANQKRIDVEKFLEYLSSPTDDRLYLKDWKARKDSLAYLMKLFDVKIFELPPNIALHSIRAYSDQKVVSTLKLQNRQPRNAVDSMKSARFYQMMAGQKVNPSSILRETEVETSNEYLRAQKHAAKGDKALNKAIAKSIEEALKEDEISANIFCESSEYFNNGIKPDIIVKLGSKVYCLEITWRTTGAGIDGEESKQNTLTPGHIQKYVLEKVMEYVKAFNL